MERKLALKNNKGFTLIELIVVVAILAACTGLVTASVSVIFSSGAAKCADGLNAAISKCRISAMSRSGSVYLRLYRNGASNHVMADYLENGVVKTSDDIGSSSCGVTFDTDAEHTLGALGSGSVLCLTFDRDTGALVTLKSDGSQPADSIPQCGSIAVSGGGRTYKISFVPATGAHTLEE